jgi:uncharacterized protein
LWYGTGRDVRERASLRDDLLDEGALVAVVVPGVRGTRFVLREEVSLLDAAAAELAAETTAGGRPRPGGQDAGVVFLAPLDPLAWDRDLLATLFAFHYRWEVYVPAAKRRWGYYVLPLLYGDRFVGRIEPRIHRPSGTLRILGLWFEEGFDPLGPSEDGFVDAFAGALRAHLAFAGLRRVAFPRAVRHRALVAAVRERL